MLLKVTKEFIFVSMADTKAKNLHMQVKGEFGRRLEALAKKNGLKNPHIVSQAIFEKYDREIGDAKKK